MGGGTLIIHKLATGVKPKRSKTQRRKRILVYIPKPLSLSQMEHAKKHKESPEEF
jgi:hypothetical protein